QRSDFQNAATLTNTTVTVIPPKSSVYLSFQVNMPGTNAVRDGYGPILIDASATAHDLHHRVNDDSVLDPIDSMRARPQFVLQQPPVPTIESIALQPLMYRGEPGVKLAISMFNGAKACTTDVDCTLERTTCDQATHVCGGLSIPTAGYTLQNIRVCMQN